MTERPAQAASNEDGSRGFSLMDIFLPRNKEPTPSARDDLTDDADVEAMPEQRTRATRKRSKRTHSVKRRSNQRNKVAQQEQQEQQEPQREAGYIMRDGDSVGLVAMLPWWRSSEMYTIRYLDRAAASQVLTATDAWVRVNLPTADINHPVIAEAPPAEEQAATDEPAPDASLALALPENSEPEVSDPVEPRPILQVAQEAPGPADSSWLHNLLVVLGGALAAASTARFFFV